MYSLSHKNQTTGSAGFFMELQNKNSDPEVRRSELLERFLSSRNQSLELCKNLKTEDYVVQPAPFVSPIKWHLAHTTWFYEELFLSRHVEGYQKFATEYGVLFNSYYKTAGDHWAQGSRGMLSRPTLSEILEYRSAVDSHVAESMKVGVLDETMEMVLELGINHEEQHAEIMLMDIKYILSQGIPMSYSALSKVKAPKVGSSWLDFPEGIYEVGLPFESFGYDNESPRHKTYLYPFAIKNQHVTNGEYLEFIKARGYDDPSLWLSLGWDWIKSAKITAPLYWRNCDAGWKEYTLFGEELLDLNAPVVHVSYFEAAAFAKWSGMRLPSEFELEIYLEARTKRAKRAKEGQTNPSDSDQGSIFHPVDAGQDTYQVWNWTQSQYSPYPRFRPMPGVLSEYNGKFMCNQFVLKSGCSATPSGHLRPSYRNFYLPEQRWMFSGIKLARDL